MFYFIKVAPVFLVNVSGNIIFFRKIIRIIKLNLGGLPGGPGSNGLPGLAGPKGYPGKLVLE
jgi:hypothetical protein